MYKIEYLKSVVKQDIPKLSKTEKTHIRLAIENRLLKNPIYFGKPLRYSLKSCRSFRVGNFRIIFKLEKQTILIVKIAHRKDAYRLK